MTQIPITPLQKQITLEEKDAKELFPLKVVCTGDLVRNRFKNQNFQGRRFTITTQYQNTMEHSFLNYANSFPYYYTLIPFQQYSSPKICNVLQVVNNLDDSTLPQPSTPDNGFLLSHNPTTPSHDHQNSASKFDSEQEKQTKAQKTSKVIKKKQKEEYRPYERQGKKKRNFLKDNRNVLPIKIRQMLSFLTRQKKSQEIIQKYVRSKTYFSNFNQKKFYAFLKMKKEKVGNYVTLPVLKQFLNVQVQKNELYETSQQKLYLQLVRVLLGYYLHHISPLCSLTSNRIRSNQKLQHVKIQRQLIVCLQDSQF